MKLLLLLCCLIFSVLAKDIQRPSYVQPPVDESNEDFKSAFNIPFVNAYANHLAYDVVIAINATVSVVTNILNHVPGTRLVGKYIKASHQNDPGRTVVEVFLFVFMLSYIFQQRRRNKSMSGSSSRLTEDEVEELIDDWEPESLVPEELSQTQTMDLNESLTIVGASGPKMTIRLTDVHGNPRSLDGVPDGEFQVTNCTAYNFLGYLNNQDLREEALRVLRSYGVGSCGPPGFYGTLDLHMQLEKTIASFIGTEQAIIYSQGFSTISSAIPAFAKRGDILLVDESVSFSIQKGIQISRSTIKTFRHNDMAHLESLLKEIAESDKRRTGKLNKRFIITEGIFANNGDIAPLPDLVSLKHKYKWRLIVEESMSFGVLGKQGRGLTEHFGVDPHEVDIIAASMGNVLGAGGGFVAGSMAIIDHQRLSGQAYCFSASLPAVLAVTAKETLNRMAQDDLKIAQLRKNTKIARQVLDSIPEIHATGDSISALIHLRFEDRKEYFRSRDEEEQALQQVCNEALKSNILVTRAKYVTPQENRLPQPSIRFVCTSALTESETKKAAEVVKAAFGKVIATLPKR